MIYSNCAAKNITERLTLAIQTHLKTRAIREISNWLRDKFPTRKGLDFN